MTTICAAKSTILQLLLLAEGYLPENQKCSFGNAVSQSIQTSTPLCDKSKVERGKLSLVYPAMLRNLSHHGGFQARIPTQALVHVSSCHHAIVLHLRRVCDPGGAVPRRRRWCRPSCIDNSGPRRRCPIKRESVRISKRKTRSLPLGLRHWFHLRIAPSQGSA